MSWEPQVGDHDNNGNNNNNKINWNEQGIRLFGKLNKQFDCKNKKWNLMNDRNKTITGSSLETFWNELESSQTMNTMTFVLDEQNGLLSNEANDDAKTDQGGEDGLMLFDNDEIKQTSTEINDENNAGDARLEKIIKQQERVKKDVMSIVENAVAEYAKKDESEFFLTDKVACNIESFICSVLNNQIQLNTLDSIILEIKRWNVLNDKIQSSFKDIRDFLTDNSNNDGIMDKLVTLPFVLVHRMAKEISQMDSGFLSNSPLSSLVELIDELLTAFEHFAQKFEKIFESAILSLHDFGCKLPGANELRQQIENKNKLKQKMEQLNLADNYKAEEQTDHIRYNKLHSVEKAQSNETKQIKSDFKNVSDDINCLVNKFGVCENQLPSFSAALYDLISIGFDIRENINIIRHQLNTLRSTWISMISDDWCKGLKFRDAMTSDSTSSRWKLLAPLADTLEENGFKYCVDLACYSDQDFEEFVLNKLIKHSNYFKDKFSNDDRLMRTFKLFCVKKQYQHSQKMYLQVQKQDLIEYLSSLIEFCIFYQSKIKRVFEVMKRKNA